VVGHLASTVVRAEVRAVNLVDVWDPGEILRLILAEDIGVGGGATFFLTSLLDHPDFTDEHLARMPFAGLGGSSVPAAVTERATRLGIKAFRSYGSTEHPSITGSLVDEPEAKRLYTDGHPLPGVEIRLDEHLVQIDTVQEAQKLGIVLIHQELNLAENLDIAGNLSLGRRPTVAGPPGLLDPPV